MDYSKNLQAIIENAKLDIVEYDVDYKTELGHRNRIMPFYVVSYMKEGTCRLRLRGQDFYAAQGDVVLIPPNRIHDHVKDTNETTLFMWWHFTYKLFDVVDVLSLFELPVCFKLPDTTRFEAAFAEYIKYAGQPGKISDYIIKEAKALELIAILLEAAISQYETNMENCLSDSFVSILSDIVSNPEKGVYLHDLSERYHMHPTYISNQFKKLFGISPIQLQKEICFTKAKNLLLNEKLSIKEIAELVGYDSLDDFSRFFKNRVGVSPLHYRKSKTNLKELVSKGVFSS